MLRTKKSVILSEGEVLRTAVVSLRSCYCPAQQRAGVEGPGLPEHRGASYRKLSSRQSGEAAFPEEN
jgi:hypothetical protein